MKRRLVAAIACRNKGTRLYGKPLQNLDTFRHIRIIDQIIDCIKSIGCIDEIVLGISEGIDNLVFTQIAEDKGLKYIIGDETDVLHRLVQCGRLASATDIFRITSESPFLYFDEVEKIWSEHVYEQVDASFMDDIVDGCGFEILTLRSLELSHAQGEQKHRSEMCTLYIREHPELFQTKYATPPTELVRKDLRLTVDNPEDLAVCRTVYCAFRELAPRIPVAEIVNFLDANPDLIKMIAPFTETGYSTMYIKGYNPTNS